MNNPNVINLYSHRGAIRTLPPTKFDMTKRNITFFLAFFEVKQIEKLTLPEVGGRRGRGQEFKKKFALLYNKLLTESLDSSIAALNERILPTHFHRIFCFWERKTKDQTRRENETHSPASTACVLFFFKSRKQLTRTRRQPTHTHVSRRPK